MSDNIELQANIKALFNQTNPPWGVALAGYIAKSFYTLPGIPEEVHLCFDKLNACLLNWWPEMKPPLGDIYSTEYDQCLNVYFSLDANNIPLMNNMSVLINASLIQIKMLSLIEIKCDEPRPGIGNDVCDITLSSLENLMSSYMQEFSTTQTTYLNDWIQSCVSEMPSDWGKGLCQLFEPIDGYPQVNI